MNRLLHALPMIVLAAACGGDGGAKRPPEEPPFDISTVYSTVFGNYKLGAKSTLVSFTTSAQPGTLSCIVQDESLPTYLVVRARITSPLAASVEAAALDADGNPATTRDVQSVPLTASDDTIVFSEDGVEVTLDFGVVVNGQTVTYSLKAYLRSTTTSLPAPPG